MPPRVPPRKRRAGADDPQADTQDAAPAVTTKKPRGKAPRVPREELPVTPYPFSIDTLPQEFAIPQCVVDYMLASVKVDEFSEVKRTEVSCQPHRVDCRSLHIVQHGVAQGVARETYSSN